jgi:hypothetical protein
MQITDNIVAQYLVCKYGAYLQSRGTVGTPNDYALMVSEVAADYRRRGKAFMAAKHETSVVSRNEIL